MAWGQGMRAWRNLASLQTEVCVNVWRAATAAHWEQKRAQTLATRIGQRKAARGQRCAVEMAASLLKELNLFRNMIRTVKPQGWERWKDPEVVAWGRARRDRLHKEAWERSQRVVPAEAGGGSNATGRRKRRPRRLAVATTESLRITDFFARVVMVQREDG